MNHEAISFIVLFGKTGCGKSAILHHIEASGRQVLHLEELAGHNGSAFGGLKGKEQPDQEAFEHEILKRLESFDKDKPVWVEYEGAYLGKLQLPEPLYARIRQSELLIVKMERDWRIKRIIDDYAAYGEEKLLEAAQKVRKKMSYKKHRLLKNSIRSEDYQTAVSILLTYYDKIYTNGMKSGDFSVIGELDLLSENAEENARQIIHFYQELPESRNPV